MEQERWNIMVEPTRKSWIVAVFLLLFLLRFSKVWPIQVTVSGVPWNWARKRRSIRRGWLKQQQKIHFFLLQILWLCEAKVICGDLRAVMVDEVPCLSPMLGGCHTGYEWSKLWRPKSGCLNNSKSHETWLVQWNNTPIEQNYINGYRPHINGSILINYCGFPCPIFWHVSRPWLSLLVRRKGLMWSWQSFWMLVDWGRKLSRSYGMPRAGGAGVETNCCFFGSTLWLFNIAMV